MTLLLFTACHMCLVLRVEVFRVSELRTCPQIVGSLALSSADPLPAGFQYRFLVACLVTAHGHKSHDRELPRYVEYTSDFSSDATTAVLEDSKFKKREFFDDLVAFSGSAGSAAA